VIQGDDALCPSALRLEREEPVPCSDIEDGQPAEVVGEPDPTELVCELMRRLDARRDETTAEVDGVEPDDGLDGFGQGRLGHVS
jgi:hypothetical protein